MTDSANTDIVDDNYVKIFFSGLLLRLRCRTMRIAKQHLRL
jgi:hypothetical protein